MKQELQYNVDGQTGNKRYSDEGMHSGSESDMMKEVKDMIGIEFGNIRNMCNLVQMDAFLEDFTRGWGILSWLTPHPNLIYASSVVRRPASYLS
jgi:hypothetical protein